MTFQARVKCLICRKLTDPPIILEKETNTEILNHLHSKLCLALKLEFSPKFQDWDFADEPFPYCESCGQRLQRLGELIDQLKSIEEEISGSLATVSALVITSDKNDSDSSDPLIRPKLGQAKDYFKSRRLEEKHNYFRSLIIERFDPRVNVERCDDNCNYPNFSDEKYEPVPENTLLMMLQPAIEGFFPDITTVEDEASNQAEYKVDTSSDNDFVSPYFQPDEAVMGLGELWSSLSEGPTGTLDAHYSSDELENPASTSSNSPNNDPVRTKSSSYQDYGVLCDEASKTYQINGFKFKELENGFECCTCGNVYPIPKGDGRFKRRNITRHVLSVHMGIRKSRVDKRGPRVCGECGDVFPTLQTLYLHRIKVHRSPRFQCGYCGAKFPLNSKLKQHVITHSEHKPYPCDQCDKSFFRKWHLEKHSRVHTSRGSKERPPSSLNLKTQSGLRVQTARAPDKKVFLCDICGAGFGVKGNLSRHVQNVHGKDRPAVLAVVEESGGQSDSEEPSEL